MFLSKLFSIKYWSYRIRYYKVVKKIATRPKWITIGKNVKFLHPEHISIGEGSTILDNAALCPLHSHMGKKYPSKIIIGNNVSIGPFDRIASAYSVTIEDDVLFAAFVHITDHSHDFDDPTLPIVKQSITHKGPVRIGRGSWIAFGAHILSGVTIGEHCVVAANSVVTKDVPSFSVVAGNPARIVRQYNFTTNKWEKV